jgi:hypothetical protein
MKCPLCARRMYHIRTDKANRRTYRCTACHTEQTERRPDRKAKEPTQ